MNHLSLKVTASGGIMAYLMELIRRATYLAVAEGQPTVDQAVLARAFDQRLAMLRRGIANPFRDDQSVAPAGRQRTGRNGRA